MQNILAFSLLSKNLKIKIHRYIILPVVVCGCEKWSLTFREESRLKVFEIWVLKSIFSPKSDDVTEEWRNYIMRSLMISALHPIFLV